MDGLTLTVILGCACATALLNCGLRHEQDPFAAALTVAIGGGMVAVPALFFTGLPDVQSVPYLIVSTAIAVAYWLAIGRAYQSSEISVVYPLAYGSAPPSILFLGSFVFEEELSLSQLTVIMLISAGLLLVFKSGSICGNRLDRATVINCIAVTACICAYTICDALAVRKTGSPFAYTVALFISSGTVLLIYSVLRHRERLAAVVRRNWYSGLVWGALSLLIYCGELWAMTRAPVALVSALRETSIIFAILFAITWLREPVKPIRIAGAGVVAFGVVLMRLA